MVLRVKLEVVPFGDEDKAYEIGRLDIFNMGHIEFGHCEYGVLNLSPGEEGQYNATVYHRRSLGAWELVRKTLEQVEITGPSSPSPKPDQR